MAISVKGNTSNVVYGKGDICLKLNPFDNFRLFTLYDDWRNDDRKPLDLSNGQKLYLIFKSKKSEIRIPEYDLVDSNYTVDKVNGQVLFKISKKNAIDILAMDTDIFYITRVYDIMDSTGQKVTSSEEEVLYTGKFKDETSNTVENYTSQVKSMMNLINDKNEQIKKLQDSNTDLLKQNTELTSQVTTLQEEIDKLNSYISELETRLAIYESGNEYDGTILDTNATISYSSTSEQYTEEGMSNSIKTLQENLQK